MARSKSIAVLEQDHAAAVLMIHTDRIVDDAAIEQLDHLINEAEHAPVRYLLIDFQNVAAVCTALLARLLKARKRLWDSGIRMKLCYLERAGIVAAANDTYAHEVFKILDLKKLFDICNRPAHAVAERIAAYESEFQLQNDGGSTGRSLVC